MQEVDRNKHDMLNDFICSQCELTLEDTESVRVDGAV